MALTHRFETRNHLHVSVCVIGICTVSIVCLLGVLFVLERLKLSRERQATRELLQRGGVILFHVDSQTWTDQLPFVSGSEHVAEVSIGSLDCISKIGTSSLGRYLKSLSELPSDLGVQYLNDLTYLTNLRIESRLLTDSDIDVIAQIRTLEDISLSSDQITFDGVKRLLDLPRLRRLELGGVSLTEESHKKLQSLRPDLTIEIAQTDWQAVVDYVEQKKQSRMPSAEDKSDSSSSEGAFPNLIDVY